MSGEAADRLALLLQGRIPARIDLARCEQPEERRLGEMVNQLIDFMREIHDFIMPLSRGELHDLRPRTGNFLASPFKELHSRLLHLAWQAKQVAMGDYEQRVDFMGDFSAAFNGMVIALAEKEKLLRDKIAELEQALSHIKRLEGILPICSNCKKIRINGADPAQLESWTPIENYLQQKTEARFTHSICPECMGQLYPELRNLNRDDD
jgi:hypothetical protein